MLDLEKRYKLARLHNSQTSPTLAPAVSLQSQTQPPIQASRRDSRDFLEKHNDGQAHLKMVPRATPVAALTVNIPPPSVAIQQRVHSHGKGEGNEMAPSEAEQTPKQESHSETTPRQKKTRFIMDDDAGKDADQDYPSDHSSICHSPSWEGYGHKKKGKKTETGQRKKDKDRAGHDQKVPEKKTTNRLYKSPPQGLQRPPVSFITRQEGILKSSISSSIDDASMRKKIVPEASKPPKIAETRAIKTRSASAQIATAPPADPPHHSRPHLPHAPGIRSHEKNARGASPAKAVETSSKKQPLDAASAAATNVKPAPATTTATKTSYPPQSSRTHNLNMPMPRAHVRRNSASAIASAKLEEMSNFFRSKNARSQLDGNVSDQEPNSGSTAGDRGRPGGSYVSRVRAQSIERSITGFIEQTALSFSNRVSGQSSKHRGHHNSGSQSSVNEEAGANESAVEEPTAPVGAESTSHFHSASKANSSTSSDLTTATAHTGGMISSIKSRIRRRSSSSSSTIPVAAYKFREKAVNAQRSSQTTLSSQMTVSEQASTISPKDLLLPPRKIHADAFPSHTVRTNGRPSEVSSSSSYPGDFSVPPSPDTPDTSRPQSIQGSTATVEKGRIGSEVLMSGALSSGAAKAESTTQPTQPTQTTHGPQEKDVANRNEGHLSRSGARHGGEIERPMSRGRFLERVERPGSRGRFLEDVEQPVLQSDDTPSDGDSDTPTAPDIDALSFVTTLTNQETHTETPPKTGHESSLTGPTDHQSGHVLEDKTGPEAKASGSQPRMDKRDKVHALKHMSMLNEAGQSSKRPKGSTSTQSDGASTSGLVPPTPPASSSGRSSPSTAYLQEARLTAPTASSPLANVVNSAKASLSNPTLSATPKPELKTVTSFSSQPSSKALLPISGPHRRIPAHEPEKLSKPIAKMLVQCCHCRFFHDMPSRIYECMAQPDAVVTDRNLGVSGAITTMVKCPWCAHNMSRKCCAGYAAVVYLKERLH